MVRLCPPSPIPATNRLAAEAENRPKSAHRYNVAEQQQIYKSEIERIWKAQHDSLSRKDEPELSDNEEDKKYFEAALAWDLELDGKAWADGKNVSLVYTLSFLISIVLTSKLPTVQVKCVFIKDLVASPGSTRTL